MEKIIEAAIKFEGKVYLGPRHYLIIKDIFKETGKGPGSRGQGFLTNTQRFVTRQEARKIAIAASQVNEEDLVTKSLIFSEDLWEHHGD